MTTKEIKFYDLLKVKEVERGFAYSKHIEINEETVKKSKNLELLIKELESKYPKAKQDWILIPKHLIKENNFRYQKDDYVIVASKLEYEE